MWLNFQWVCLMFSGSTRGFDINRYPTTFGQNSISQTFLFLVIFAKKVGIVIPNRWDSWFWAWYDNRSHFFVVFVLMLHNTFEIPESNIAYGTKYKILKHRITLDTCPDKSRLLTVSS